MENKVLNVVEVTKNENIKTISNKKKEIKKNSVFDFFKKFSNSTMQSTNKQPINEHKEEIEQDSTSSTNLNEKSNFFTKILKNKNAKVAIVVLIFALSALLILNSSNIKKLTSTNSGTSKNYTTSLEYCEMLENKLTSVLSKMSGVGNVKVMVTVSSSPELIIASSSDEKTNTTTNGSSSQTNSTVSKDPIIVTNGGNNSALILTEKTPEITGVVVVAEGARDVKIKLSLLEAVQALLNVKGSNIQIYY